MGQLVRGDWVDERIDAGKDDKGHFVRQQAQFRRAIGDDFPPEAGRYHLYLATACPWCHRLDIARRLKGLEDVISVSYVHPLMREGGWRFVDGGHEDPLYGYDFVHQLYSRAAPDYTGRVTVPLLWDRQGDEPVSNESSEILRMFDHGFGSLATDTHALYPEAHRGAIDRWNERIYETLNNGVYRCGFAHTQAAYEEAFGALFDTLDALEEHLEGRAWLVGDAFTEADLRLFVTLVRFDAVYFGHFKCNRSRISDLPNLQGLLERVYGLPGVAETVHIDEIKRHYYGSHVSLNPKGIVPVGPALPWLR